MIDISAARSKRTGDAPPGALIAFRYGSGANPIAFGINVPGTPQCRAGALVLQKDGPPEFVIPTAYCIVIAERPIVTWDGELSTVASLSAAGAQPGDLIVTPDKLLLCGRMPTDGQAYETWAWNLEGGQAEAASVASDSFAVRRWAIGRPNVHSEFRPLASFGFE